MNADYVAWNGERYVWPPPDGWYLASDGRWWAADTGPEMDLDVVADASAPADDFTESVGFDEPYIAPAEAFTPPTDSAAGRLDIEPRPLTEPGLDPLQTTPISGPVTAVTETVASTLVTGGPDDSLDLPQSAPTPLAEAQESLVDLEPAPDLDSIDEPETDPEDRIQRSRTMPMVAAGLLVAAALAIAALLALVGGDNDESTQQPSASADAETDAGDGELVVDTDESSMEDGSMDDGVMDDGVMDDAMSEEDAASSSTTTGGDTPTTSNAEGESGDAILIGQFRTLLEENEITAAELTGEDVMVFGETACSYATAASDLEGYQQIRNEALAGAANEELTPEELQLVVDTAVTVFCSEEAARLGLTLSPAEDA